MKKRTDIDQIVKDREAIEAELYDLDERYKKERDQIMVKMQALRVSCPHERTKCNPWWECLDCGASK